MRIAVVAPVPAASTRGNGVTARRWARLLGALGHEVVVREAEGVPDADLLVALHARKSAAVVRGFRGAFPGRPVVLAMTGTDLYADLPGDPDAVASVRAA